MKNTNRYSPEELDVRLRFFAGVMLVVVFSGSLATVLYNLVWVEQPMSGIAPADKAFFEILKMMTAFLSGVITTLVARNPSTSAPINQPRVGGCPSNFNMPNPIQTSFVTNSVPVYTPPPGPVGGPHLDSDEERFIMAQARQMQKGL